MALQSKTLKNIGKALFTENTIKNAAGNSEGGLSALLVHKKFTGLGAAVALGTVGAVSTGDMMIKGHNKAKLGRISYGGGPARMTSSFTSGAVEAMNKASNGNYAVFSDIASDVMKNNSISGAIEDYGATPELVSALYGMGGR